TGARAACKIASTASLTSGPIPSPGINTTECVDMGLLIVRGRRGGNRSAGLSSHHQAICMKRGDFAKSGTLVQACLACTEKRAQIVLIARAVRLFRFASPIEWLYLMI